MSCFSVRASVCWSVRILCAVGLSLTHMHVFQLVCVGHSILEWPMCISILVLMNVNVCVHACPWMTVILLKCVLVSPTMRACLSVFELVCVIPLHHTVGVRAGLCACPWLWC